MRDEGVSLDIDQAAINNEIVIVIQHIQLLSWCLVSKAPMSVFV